MKPAKDAFALAIERAERALRNSAQSPPADMPKERGHKIAKLSEAREKARRLEAREILNQVRKLGVDPETFAQVEKAAKAHATSSENWIFVMLSPSQNAEVIQWLQSNSKRPHKAVMVWARMLEHLRIDTGEVMATRQELAERVDIEPRDLSKIMTELVSINAVRREKAGRSVKYYLNPTIATHMPSASARAAARERAGPLLELMEGGKKRSEPE